mmetsp:Transcript_46053/g.110419  ORF Transcript_46053/g.110419 Transcript_46053/m.110419 type:complete len:248 (+) Transcript_46053:100-843(+)
MLHAAPRGVVEGRALPALLLAGLGGGEHLQGLQAHPGVDADEGAEVEGVDVDLDLAVVPVLDGHRAELPHEIAEVAQLPRLQHRAVLVEVQAHLRREHLVVDGDGGHIAAHHAARAAAPRSGLLARLRHLLLEEGAQPHLVLGHPRVGPVEELGVVEHEVEVRPQLLQVCVLEVLEPLADGAQVHWVLDDVRVVEQPNLLPWHRRLVDLPVDVQPRVVDDAAVGAAQLGARAVRRRGGARRRGGRRG